MKQVAIITGITGQDGSYLAEDLLNEGVHVFGGIRRSASSPYNLQRISHLLEHPNLKLIYFDMIQSYYF